MSKVAVKDVPRARIRIADEAILDAATTVFAAEGFARANMDAIAASAGATKPTLYARFGSKEQLFAAAAGREYGLLKRGLFEAYDVPDDRPFGDRLDTWVAAYFDFVRERPAGFRLLTEAGRHPASAAIIDATAREIVDRIAALVIQVSARDARGGAHIVAAMITGILTGCAREASRQPGTDLDAASALCESFLHSALRGVDPDLIEAIA